MYERKDGPLVKKGKIYRKDCEWMVLEWDENGIYKGQWQDNMLDDDPSPIFIGPDPTGKCFVANLTKEEMDKAKSAL